MQSRQLGTKTQAKENIYLAVSKNDVHAQCWLWQLFPDILVQIISSLSQLKRHRAVHMYESVTWGNYTPSLSYSSLSFCCLLMNSSPICFRHASLLSGLFSHVHYSDARTAVCVLHIGVFHWILLELLTHQGWAGPALGATPVLPALLGAQPSAFYCFCCVFPPTLRM